MSNFFIKGIYRDRIFDAEEREIFNSGWRSNLIVLRCRILIAAFIRNDKTLGIRELQLGKGESSWDTTPPPAPDPNTMTQLIDPDPYRIDHVELDMYYLNSVDEIVPGPTNRIQIVAKIGPDKPTPSSEPYPLREFGIFGEFNDSLYMINYIRHALIEKDASATLERKLRLIF
jgi:hypothetical protein